METQPESKPKGVRRSRAEIEALLEAFERSGQSKYEFCRDHGLKETTFSVWRRKRPGASASSPGFHPVVLSAGRACGGPRVRTPGGFEIDMPVATTAVEIAALIEVLGRGRSC